MVKFFESSTNSLTANAGGIQSSLCSPGYGSLDFSYLSKTYTAIFMSYYKWSQEPLFINITANLKTELTGKNCHNPSFFDGYNAPYDFISSPPCSVLKRANV